MVFAALVKSAVDAVPGEVAYLHVENFRKIIRNCLGAKIKAAKHMSLAPYVKNRKHGACTSLVCLGQ
jgi:hypothetical protein